MNPVKLERSYAFDQGIVRYSVFGEGPPVVFVHGTPWSSVTWHRLAAVLGGSYQVHLYDYVGYGQSEKRTAQKVGLNTQSRLFTELVSHWGLTRPLVIAHDFGGATTLRSHLLDGTDYSALVLIDVVAMAPWGSPFFAHVQKNEAVFCGNPDYIHKAIVETYVKDALYGEIAQDELDALIAPWVSPEGKPAFYRQMAQATQAHTDEIEPEYGAVRCPVQILWGEHDRWIPIATGKRLHKAILQSEFHQVPNAGHLAQLENPDFVERQVVSFLNRYR